MISQNRIAKDEDTIEKLNATNSSTYDAQIHRSRKFTALLKQLLAREKMSLWAL